MRNVHYALAPLLAISLAGCATIFGDNTKDVIVNSAPAGATISVNHTPLPNTTTPNSILIPSTWDPTIITVEKKGYAPQNVTVDTVFQPVGWWNILFWPGFIVDAISGDMRKVNPDQHVINVQLQPVHTHGG